MHTIIPFLLASNPEILSSREIITTIPELAQHLHHYQARLPQLGFTCNRTPPTYTLITTIPSPSYHTPIIPPPHPIPKCGTSNPPRCNPRVTPYSRSKSQRPSCQLQPPWSYAAGPTDCAVDETKLNYLPSDELRR